MWFQLKTPSSFLLTHPSAESWGLPPYTCCFLKLHTNTTSSMMAHILLVSSEGLWVIIWRFLMHWLQAPEEIFSWVPIILPRFAQHTYLSKDLHTHSHSISFILSCSVASLCASPSSPSTVLPSTLLWAIPCASEFPTAQGVAGEPLFFEE